MSGAASTITAERSWAKGDLRVRRATLDRVFEEAVLAYARDEESCGLLTGPAADPLLVDGIVPMKNRANDLHRLDPETYPRTGRTYFDVDPLAFERTIRAQEAAGAPGKVLYHSHLDVGAYFSETDATAANGGGDAPTYDLAYLVTSVRGGRVDDHALFVWSPEARAFVPSKLSVV